MIHICLNLKILIIDQLPFEIYYLCNSENLVLDLTKFIE